MGRTMAQAALEQQKINQAGESQGFANRAAAQSEQLRGVLLDPNATPEQRSVAQRNLAALSGKSDSWKAVALQGGTDAQGNKTESLLGAVNERTGEMKRMEGQGAKPQPLNNHVAALKANPAQAAFFDEIYGAGAAAKALKGG